MSQPSRWDKDRRFEKRCREEGPCQSKKPTPTSRQTMTLASTRIGPSQRPDYLKWLIKNLDFVPDYVATNYSNEMN